MRFSNGLETGLSIVLVFSSANHKYESNKHRKRINMSYIFPPEIILNGIIVGTLYGFTAMGLALVAGVTKIINCFHGASLMLGAYISYFTSIFLNIDPFFTVPISMSILAVIGFGIHKGLIERLLKKPELSGSLTLLATYALLQIATASGLIVWTANIRYMRTIFMNVRIELFGISSTMEKILSFLFAISITTILVLFLRRTFVGKAVRATAEDRVGALLMSLDVSKMYLLTFVLGSALAGGAGSIIGIITPFTPNTSFTYLLTCFSIMALGGMGNISGAFLGGLILGLSENLGAFYLGGAVRPLVTFYLLVVVLLLKPEGLLGGK